MRADRDKKFLNKKYVILKRGIWFESAKFNGDSSCSFEDVGTRLHNSNLKVHLRTNFVVVFRKIDINYYLKVKTEFKSFNPVKFYRAMKIE